MMPFKRWLMVSSARRWLLGILLAGFATGAVGLWGAFQGEPKATPQLAAMLPQGALLTIESRDFGAVLKAWNDSPEKRAWVKSDNASIFSRSRLFGRLGDAQTQFSQVAGLSPDMSFLSEVAGRESIFGWYDIGKLEFLYITRIPASTAEKSHLLEMRSKFSMRRVGTQTFYVKTETDESQSEPRTVAFAVSGDWLLLATREDLMAGALTHLAAVGPGAQAKGQQDSVAAEPWFADAVAAAPKESGQLRMTLNLEKIVPSPYFRSYWIQRNVSEMKPFRSAIADLYLTQPSFREERVLLPKVAPTPIDNPPDLGALTAMLPDHAGVYRATAMPSVDMALQSLDEKLLERGHTVDSTTQSAPSADVTVHEIGSANDLETRIDTAPPPTLAKGAELSQLRATLTEANLKSMMTVTRSAESTDHLSVGFRSAVVFSSAKDWNAGTLQSALQQVLRARLTTAALGLEWKTVDAAGGSYSSMGNVSPLQMAVRGPILIVANDAGLMQEILDRDAHPAAPAVKQPGPQTTVMAGFNLSAERKPFAKWTATVDRGRAGQSSPPVDAPDADADAGQPAFFSRNVRSLADSFAQLESERLVERRDGPLTRQTVTYTWH